MRWASWYRHHHSLNTTYRINIQRAEQSSARCEFRSIGRCAAKEVLVVSHEGTFHVARGVRSSVSATSSEITQH